MTTLKLTCKRGYVKKVSPVGILPDEVEDKLDKFPDVKLVNLLCEMGWKLLTVVSLGEWYTEIWFTKEIIDL